MLRQTEHLIKQYGKDKAYLFMIKRELEPFYNKRGYKICKTFGPDSVEYGDDEYSWEMVKQL